MASTVVAVTLSPLTYLTRLRLARFLARLGCLVCHSVTLSVLLSHPSTHPSIPYPIPIARAYHTLHWTSRVDRQYSTARYCTCLCEASLSPSPSLSRTHARTHTHTHLCVFANPCALARACSSSRACVRTPVPGGPRYPDHTARVFVSISTATSLFVAAGQPGCVLLPF